MPCKVVSRRRNFLQLLAAKELLFTNRAVIRKVSKIMLLLAVIAGVLCPGAFAQDITPTPQTADQPVATTVEVIVTGSNIPTAEEVGPQPVDTYRRDDIFRLGVRSATDFVQKLPMATGVSINENLTTIGDGRTEIDLRGLRSQGNPGVAGRTSSRN